MISVMPITCDASSVRKVNKIICHSSLQRLRYGVDTLTRALYTFFSFVFSLWGFFLDQIVGRYPYIGSE